MPNKIWSNSSIVSKRLAPKKANNNTLNKIEVGELVQNQPWKPL
jgi:hypothetical protein